MGKRSIFTAGNENGTAREKLCLSTMKNCRGCEVEVFPGRFGSDRTGSYLWIRWVAPPRTLLVSCPSLTRRKFVSSGSNSVLLSSVFSLAFSSSKTYSQKLYLNESCFQQARSCDLLAEKGFQTSSQYGQLCLLPVPRIASIASQDVIFPRFS